jgi:hypothetical protein
MTPRIRERGEGKIGCIVSLIVLGLASAAGIKLIPVYYSNNELVDAASRKAESAAGRNPEDMVKEIREAAKKLEIPEAMAAGAITMTKRASGDVGSVVVKLRYTRKVDLYGVTEVVIVMDKVIDKPLLENVK